jgi:hypothetical protein
VIAQQFIKKGRDLLLDSAVRKVDLARGIAPVVEVELVI